MPVEIRETIVTTAPDGEVVQLHISDAPPDDESASFVLTLQAKVGPFENPMLSHLHVAAMTAAADVLNRMIAEATGALRRQGYPHEPRPRAP